MQKTLIITALATALAVGGYQHHVTVTELQDRITGLEGAVVPQDKQQFMAEFLGGLESSPEPAPREPAPDNWIYGSASARYTLVEMTDTECPYCAAHFPLLKELVGSAGGHINAALLHVPALSEASRKQALAIECAGDQGGSEAAWKYAQLVFDKTGGNGKGVSESLAALAGTLGLESNRFLGCMESPSAHQRIASDLEQAIKLGVQQTPSTIVIDNQTGASMLLQGANASHEGILKAIASLDQQGVPK